MDLGDLADSPPVATTFDWKLQYSLPALGVWVFVIGAVVLVKPNRHLRVLAILAPLAILLLAWSDFTRVMGISGLDRNVYNAMFTSMLAGLATLWLLTPALANAPRLARLLVALFVMLAACAVGISASGLDGEIKMQLSIIEAGLALALLISLIIARLFAGKRATPLSFSLWLVLTTLVSCVALMTAFGLIMYAALLAQNSISPNEITELLSTILMVSLVISAVMYAVNLLFIVGASRSAVYRRSFLQCLGKPLPQPETTNPIPEIPSP